MERQTDEDWADPSIPAIEIRLLQGVFACRSIESVEAALTYARFLSSVGITPENYAVFLRVLEIENRWVIDALIGDRDPFLLLSSVQPNRYIVQTVLSMLMRWRKGGIYEKNLLMILGVLQSVYSSARDGYRIYPLRIADLNAIGKHLDKPAGQDDPLNRAILDLLDDIMELDDAGDAELEEIAIHASAIRNAFFDDSKKMEAVIPPVLLVCGREHAEIEPRPEQPTRGQTTWQQGPRPEASSPRPHTSAVTQPPPHQPRLPTPASPRDEGGSDTQ